ncbi:MAG: hypothetical protein LC789_07315 [Actinobacteria bacterium]|nr:hypothetical protein [Actinomycetota bacterium]
MIARYPAAFATLVAGLLCAAIAAAVDGAPGLVSVIVGTFVVLGFFASGIVPLLVVRGEDDRAKGLATGLLLLTYTFRLAVAVAVLRVGVLAGGLDRRWLGASIIVGAVVWTGAQVVRSVRTPDPASTEGKADR